MLDVVGVPVFVGVERPQVGLRWRHWPAGNIEHVARHIIEELDPPRPPCDQLTR